MLALIAVGTGCSVAGDRQESQYLIRLARVLELPLPAPQLFEPLTFPERRSLRLPLAAVKMDWGDFARLHACDMGDLAGFRNSALGRVMEPLVRLDYELRWLRAAERCIASDLTDPTRALIEDLMVRKRAQLSTVLWNGVMADQRIQQWQGTSAGASTDLTYQALLALTDQLPALAARELAVPGIDRALDQLASGARVGAAQLRWARARTLLGRATALLEHEPQRVCRNGQPTPKARQLRSVFQKFYANVEQPRLAAMVSSDVRWVEAFARLASGMAVTPPKAFSDWFTAVLDPLSPTSQWQRTRAAFLAHSQAWQALAERCQLDLFAR